MDRATRIQIIIELEVGSDPIAGRVDDGRDRRPFVGWLALVRALEHAQLRAALEHAQLRAADADGK